MRFLLLVHMTESDLRDMPETEYARLLQAYRDFAERGRASGQLRAHGELHGASGSSVVRAHAGRPQADAGLTPGARERIDRFFVVEANSHADANGIASAVPGARYGWVEVRQISNDSST
jgi:hypothetical protein